MANSIGQELYKHFSSGASLCALALAARLTCAVALFAYIYS